MAKVVTNKSLLISLSAAVKELQSSMTVVFNRFSGIESRLYSLEKKVDAIDQRTLSYPRLYDNVDKLVGEIIENRQERAFILARVDSHEERIGVLEKKKRTTSRDGISMQS